VNNYPPTFLARDAARAVLAVVIQFQSNKVCYKVSFFV